MNKTITPVRSFRGVIEHLPPDKSISHRAAMFAALADGKSIIRNYSQALDPQSTLDCLRALGVGISQSDDYILIVEGVGRNGFKNPDKQLDCGNSGTTIRLLSGILAGAEVECVISGDSSIEKRPMNRVIEPLRSMGARIESREGGFAPLSFKLDKPLQGITYELPIASAQVKSCVLLAGLFTDDDTCIIESEGSRDHTERMLKLPKQKLDNGKVQIRSNREHLIEPFDLIIPGDISAAAFWMVAGSIFEDSVIELKNVGINPSRSAVISILKRMGADITLKNINEEQTEPTADITVKSTKLKSTQIKPEEIANAIDEFPILAVAMAFAKGTSTLRNAHELRKKETDRIMAVVNMLKKAGADITEYEDGYEIVGNPEFVPKKATYETWHDHRIAMSSAVLSAKGKNESVVLDAECAAVSYPNFWKHFELIGNTK